MGYGIYGDGYNYEDKSEKRTYDDLLKENQELKQELFDIKNKNIELTNRNEWLEENAVF